MIKSAVQNKMVIEAVNFGFQYPNEITPLFAESNFSIKQGSLVLLYGATGSGKSTLLRLLTQDLHTEGTILGKLKVEGSVQLVMQNLDNQMICDSVHHELAFGLENLGVAPHDMRLRVAEIVHYFGIEPLIHKHPSELSQGQKRLVCLASALVMRPEILLIDEPLAELDPVTSQAFLNSLVRANRDFGTTIILSEHDASEVLDYATHVLEIKNMQATLVQASDFHDKSDSAYPKSLSILHTGKKVLTIKDLYYRYSKSEPFVIRCLDATFYEGELCAILGGNGAGKSTFFRLLAGLEKPSLGSIKFVLNTRIGLIPQDVKSLFIRDTLLDDLMELASEGFYTKEHVIELAKEFDLFDVLNQHPYDLSGGELNKAALVKLLLLDTDILLLDETTRGLDMHAKNDLSAHLQKLAWQGKTILIATHDIPFAEATASTCALMFDGSFAVKEPTSEFFKHASFIKRGQ